jgi:hypothetical protein
MVEGYHFFRLAGFGPAWVGNAKDAKPQRAQSKIVLLGAADEVTPWRGHPACCSSKIVFKPTPYPRQSCNIDTAGYFQHC